MGFARSMALGTVELRAGQQDGASDCVAILPSGLGEFLDRLCSELLDKGLRLSGCTQPDPRQQQRQRRADEALGKTIDHDFLAAWYGMLKKRRQQRQDLDSFRLKVGAPEEFLRAAKRLNSS
jgi:hypothetical protein